MNTKMPKFKLTEEKGRHFIKLPDSKRKIPVKIVWLKPFDQKNSGISILNQKKEEVIYLPKINLANKTNQKIIKQALQNYTFLPTITQIKSIKINNGIRYWDTETNLGPKLFAMIKPSSYLTFIDENKLIVRDTFNNFYQIKSIKQLDTNSQKQLSKIL